MGFICRMRTLLSRATQVDPSFNVGLGLVVILAVAEIFAVTSYYVGRIQPGRMPPQAVTTTIARPAAPPVSSPAIAPPATKTAPSPEALAQTPPPSLVDQLVREGTELRDRGDTTNALARFQEALDSEPSNVNVLEEIAKTYDSMQLYDKSNEVWRKLHDMGPSAGAAYELADQRLKLGVSAPATTGAGMASASVDAASHNKDVGGNSEGSVMGITEVKAAEIPDPDAETNLALKIGIKKQPGTTVDHTKVKILVEFYDTVGDKDVKLTDADVNYEWLTPKHDWADTNPEVLSVSYLRPKTGVGSPEASLSEAAATIRPGQKGRVKSSTADSGKRKYLGYRVRIYYDDKLQAVQAEPSRLLQLFPAAENSSTP
jgi:tetratricopeptide (TPR) repeat protein